MKKLDIQTTIIAPPEVVWSKLTDTQALAGGSLGLISLTGDMRLGGHLKLVNEVAPGRTFKIEITAFDANRRMIWSDGLPLGLFKGVRSFLLTPVPNGTVLQMTEIFTGIMLPLIWKSMPDLNPGFQKFATGLKQLCESN